MRKMKIWAVAMIALVAATSVKAQEFTTSADLVSSYVWRGVQYAGVSVQPGVKFTTGGLSVGAWGSTGLKDGALGTALYNEMDLYASYATSFGLTVGLTDYYYPGTQYFDLSTATGAHGLEVNLGYTTGGLSLAANYMLNEAGGAATKGGDTYFELGYAFKAFSIFAGAGSGWHTPDGAFGVVNVGLKTSKTISITDKFSLPLSGSVILNPTTQQFFIVAGVSL
jgi:uncharacterized protein (TIGR02001 family)